MNILDIFKGDAFTLASLTDAINRLPYKPGKIGQLGLFATEGVTTPHVYIEERDGVLQLIPISAPGTPGLVNKPQDRRVRDFKTVHLQLDDSVLAKEVQGIRAFGSQDASEGVAQVVTRKIQQMRDSHEVTLEWHRLGAVKGVVYDADGVSLINDLFADFGIHRTNDMDWDIHTAETNQKQNCVNAIRLIENALGMTPYDHIHALCGDAWFDMFIAHPLVEAAYARWLDGAWLRDNQLKTGFTFAGIVFENYRGAIGDTPFIATDEMRLFPVGVPGLFKTFFSPADFIETVNTIGLPFYAKQELMDFDRGINITTESNPLSICTRPQVLIRGYGISDGA